MQAHYPDIRKDLAREALNVFFQVREVPGLKKKPATSELLDWLKLLMVEDLPVEALRTNEKHLVIPPLYGALAEERTGRASVRASRLSGSAGGLMFSHLVLALRSAGLPASITEYLTLMAAMKAGVAEYSVEDFYYLARATLVKDERHLDKFDRVFAQCFKGLEPPEGVKPSRICRKNGCASWPRNC